MSTAVPGPRPSHYKGNSKLEKEATTEETETPKAQENRGPRRH